MLPEKRGGDGAAIEEEESSAKRSRDSEKGEGGDLISGSPSSSDYSSRPANGMEIDAPAAAAANGGGRSPEIDEDLHSRQLAVYGRETMRRLFVSNVLVSGLNGLGVEIAKNLVLAGVKSVTLHDEGNVELWDLSSNFYFSGDDLGKNRALACVQKLQELNSAVLVSTLTRTLSKEQLSDFQAVVFTDIGLGKAIEFDDYCHNHHGCRLPTAPSESATISSPLAIETPSTCATSISHHVRRALLIQPHYQSEHQFNHQSD